MPDLSRSDLMWMRMASISRYYIEYVGRLPDRDGLSAYLSSPATLADIKNKILNSAEYINLEARIAALKSLLLPYAGRTKILILGAYGNGNLGDRDMALATAGYLAREKGVVCFAYSSQNVSDYSFPSERKLAAEVPVLNPRIMAAFDALVIGGGGLLAHPHDPIWTPDWAQLLPIPCGILGCGVKSPLPQQLHSLVTSAAVVSARDEIGVKELAKFNSDTLFIPDLILLSQKMETRRNLWGLRRKRRLFVLRAPLTAWHEHLRNTLGPNDDVAIFEPHEDEAIADYFPGCLTVADSGAFRKLVLHYGLVVSERYHGIVLALMTGHPVIGIWRDDHNAQKIIELLASLKLEEKCHQITQVPDVLKPYRAAGVRARLDQQRQQGERDRPEFLQRLMRGNKPAPAERYIDHSLHAVLAYFNREMHLPSTPQDKP